MWSLMLPRCVRLRWPGSRQGATRQFWAVPLYGVEGSAGCCCKTRDRKARDRTQAVDGACHPIYVSRSLLRLAGGNSPAPVPKVPAPAPRKPPGTRPASPPPLRPAGSFRGSWGILGARSLRPPVAASAPTAPTPRACPCRPPRPPWPTGTPTSWAISTPCWRPRATDPSQDQQTPTFQPSSNHGRRDSCYKKNTDPTARTDDATWPQLAGLRHVASSTVTPPRRTTI